MTGSSSTRIAQARPISNQITAVLHSLVAERDLELADHEGRVARLARSVAPELALPDEQTAALVQAAYLHDVGKLALPDALLCKRSALDEEEWSLVRQHTLVGDRILRAAGALVQAAAFVLKPRALRWAGLPRRLGRRADPVGRSDHRGLRRLRRDDLASPLPGRGDERRSRGRRAAPLIGYAV